MKCFLKCQVDLFCNLFLDLLGNAYTILQQQWTTCWRPRYIHLIFACNVTDGIPLHFMAWIWSPASCGGRLLRSFSDELFNLSWYLRENIFSCISGKSSKALLILMAFFILDIVKGKRHPSFYDHLICVFVCVKPSFFRFCCISESW